MGNLGGKKGKVTGGVGSGRGVRGGGTADKRGKTREEQKHGKKIASPLSKTPEWSGLPKKDKGTLKPGHHGVLGRKKG